MMLVVRDDQSEEVGGFSTPDLAGVVDRWRDK